MKFACNWSSRIAGKRDLPSAESKDEQEYSRSFEGEGSGWDDTRGGNTWLGIALTAEESESKVKAGDMAKVFP